MREASNAGCLRVLRSDLRYERMDITGVTGVTEAQRAALLALGASEHSPASGVRQPQRDSVARVREPTCIAVLRRQAPTPLVRRGPAAGPTRSGWGEVVAPLLPPCMISGLTHMRGWAPWNASWRSGTTASVDASGAGAGFRPVDRPSQDLVNAAVRTLTGMEVAPRFGRTCAVWGGSFPVRSCVSHRGICGSGRESELSRLAGHDSAEVPLGGRRQS
jgi:hypothetical protein